MDKPDITQSSLQAYRTRVTTLLSKKYPVKPLNQRHIDAIEALWCCEDTGTPDATDNEIVQMYEVLSMYDYMREEFNS